MAITDVFFRRYKDVRIAEAVGSDEQVFFHQANKLMGDMLWLGKSEPSDDMTDPSVRNLKIVHDKLAIETGVDYLSPKYYFYKERNGAQNSLKHKPNMIVANFMKEQFDATKNDADFYVKLRLSFVELAFRIRGEQVRKAQADFPLKLAKARSSEEAADSRPGALRVPGSLVNSTTAAHKKIVYGYANLVEELNQRLRIAGFNLVYSNGLLHFAGDELMEANVAKPFWQIVAQPLWNSVEEQMQEAIDRRDKRDRTAPFHAVCALESCMKIVFSRLNPGEKVLFGHRLINELAKDPRFLAKWEADMLKQMFSDLRNPFAHGPGTDTIPELATEQTDWAIETAMSWIKSLARRL